eukprot:g3561.t1
MVRKDYLDDLEMDEEGLGDLVMDDHAMATAPRPGTSLRNVGTSVGGSGPSPVIRPVSQSGRPLTGFARAGTSRATSSSGRNELATAMGATRPGSSARPLTSLGRLVRLGTASLSQANTKEFIIPEQLNLQRFAKKPALAKVLCEWLLYVARNPKRALELCAEATQAAEFKDWWWKARLGKCYFQLGLLEDAKRQFYSALRDQEFAETHLELAKVFLKLDQPNVALEQYRTASERFPGDTGLLLGLARTHDQLAQCVQGVQIYKQVLKYDSIDAEAISCLASHHFYTDQPEVALRFYRRLLQTGQQKSVELWNNLGLCCFYSGQYDLCLSCFERALLLADDSNMADVWYNIGHVAVGVGDLGLAYQSFRISVSVDPNHAESFNNLGVLELRKGNIEQAQEHFKSAIGLGSFLFEPAFNFGLLAFKLGEFRDSFEYANKALAAYPDHIESKELLKQLKTHFSTL